MSVRNCREIASVEWCDVTIKPLLLNNEALQDHIKKLELMPVWVKSEH